MSKEFKSNPGECEMSNDFETNHLINDVNLMFNILTKNKSFVCWLYNKHNYISNLKGKVKKRDVF